VSRASTALLAACLLLASRVVAAPQETVIPIENVRMDYAQVLRVEPVYQTLHATRSEQQCDPSADSQARGKGFSRIVGAVRNALSKNDPPAPTSPDGSNCRMVQVQREFRRPIAYDVDYLYKGMKYRSRLPDDPGNRLRVRVSVTPYLAPSDR
jgi:uncharacterized protein YcfJ